MTVERKTATAYLKRLDDKGSGVAVIATLTLPGVPPVIDKDGDMTLPGAFGAPVVPVVGAHRWDSPPIGKAQIREEGSEVLAEFKLNLATDGGREWYEALRFDYEHKPAKAAWSYGFSIPPGGAEFRTLEDGRRVRVLKRLQVFEVSPVIAAAGIGTRTLALKGTSDEHDERLARLLALPPEQQQAWLEQARGLVAESRLLELSIAFDVLSAGKQAYRYVHADPWDGRVLLAKDTVAEACAELGCGLSKTVRLFTSCDPEKADFWDDPMCGFCSKTGEIGISWNLTPEEIVWVAAHEAAHLAGMNESEADAFGEKFAHLYSAKLLGTSPRPAVAVGPVIVSAAEAKELRNRYGLEIPYMYVNV